MKTVTVKTDALQLHARSIPAHMGYTTEQFKFRDLVKGLLGQDFEVLADYGSHIKIQANTSVLTLPKYMCERPA